LSQSRGSRQCGGAGERRGNGRRRRVSRRGCTSGNGRAARRYTRVRIQIARGIRHVRNKITVVIKGVIGRVVVTGIRARASCADMGIIVSPIVAVHTGVIASKFEHVSLRLPITAVGGNLDRIPRTNREGNGLVGKMTGNRRANGRSAVSRRSAANIDIIGPAHTVNGLSRRVGEGIHVFRSTLVKPGHHTNVGQRERCGSVIIDSHPKVLALATQRITDDLHIE
jgi:hypothetical protein